MTYEEYLCTCDLLRSELQAFSQISSSQHLSEKQQLSLQRAIKKIDRHLYAQPLCGALKTVCDAQLPHQQATSAYKQALAYITENFGAPLAATSGYVEMVQHHEEGRFAVLPPDLQIRYFHCLRLCNALQIFHEHLEATYHG